MNDVIEQYNGTLACLDKLKESIDEQSISVEKTDIMFNNIANEIFSISKEITNINISLDKMKNDKNQVFKLIENTAVISEETVASSENYATVVAYHVQTVSDIIESISKTQKLLSQAVVNKDIIA